MASENLSAMQAGRGKSTPPPGGDEIDAMMSGSGGGKSPTVHRCCVGKNNPYIHLYCSGAHIFLALPTKVQTSTKPVWNSITLGDSTVMGAFLGTLANGKSLTGFMKDTASAVKDIVRDNKVSQMLATAGNSEFAKAKFGKATLPAKELQFQGIDFRTITFHWYLVPLNAKETVEIDKMIQQIQARILPGFDTGVMGYPDLWVIEWGQGQTYMPVIKDSVCTQFDVDYSGAGKTYVHNKQYAPVAYNITMTFQEATLFTREDVLVGIYG